MTPEDVAVLFADASVEFDAIAGQPTVENLHELFEVVYPILLDIPYDVAKGGKQNLVGLLLDNDAEYNAEYGRAFVRLKANAAYDKSVTNDAKASVRAKAEALWLVAIAD